MTIVSRKSRKRLIQHIVQETADNFPSLSINICMSVKSSVHFQVKSVVCFIGDIWINRAELCVLLLSLHSLKGVFSCPLFLFVFNIQSQKLPLSAVLILVVLNRRDYIELLVWDFAVVHTATQFVIKCLSFCKCLGHLQALRKLTLWMQRLPACWEGREEE